VIRIDRFDAAFGQPAGVRITTTWVEPTHEVVEVLTKAGLTSAFRSHHQQYILPGTGFTEEHTESLLDVEIEGMLLDLGKQLLDRQADDEAKAKKKAREGS
jgi:hypothetical protein